MSASERAPAGTIRRGLRRGLLLLAATLALCGLASAAWAEPPGAEAVAGRGEAGEGPQPAVELPAAGQSAPGVSSSEPGSFRLFLGPVRIPAPLPITDGQPRQVQVPMLMYHYIGDLPQGADAIRRDLTVSTRSFARHLDMIQSLGYETVTIRQIVEYLNTGARLPDKPVILTFDDGYVGQYTDAFPELSRRNMVGTFFIVSDIPYSGNTNYMDWSMVRIMARAGMEMESHAQWHLSLAGRDETYLQGQVDNSVSSFRRELGYRPRVISYPGGAFDSETIRIYRDSGFWAGVTTMYGAIHSSKDMFRLRRVRVHGADSADRLRWRLEQADGAGN